MKFDVVIGNPPYGKGKNSNFYVSFLEKSAQFLVDGGNLSLVIPNRFILPHTPASKVLKKYFKLNKVSVDVNRYFPKVGTKIGLVSATRNSEGHSGDVEITLADGNIIHNDMSNPIPSKLPTLEGIELMKDIMSKDHFVFTSKKPTHNYYVFVCRQWKSENGRIYFDAEVNGWGDGKYIETDNPRAVCDYLKTSDVGPKLHKLFGDQMNIWPFLWNMIPTSI